MKIKDCLYYSKEIMKDNKTRSRLTVAGLVIPISMICFIFSIYICILGVSSSMKKNISVCSAFLTRLNISDSCPSVKDYGGEYLTDRLGVGVFGIELKNAADSKKLTPSFEFILDEQKYDINIDDIQASFSNYADKDKLVLNSEKEYMEKNGLGDVILAGSSFGNETDEIMISSYLLDEMGISDYSSVLGKKLSIQDFLDDSLKKYYVKTADGYEDRSENYRGYTYYALYGFRIVGVFNANVYQCPSRVNMGNCLFWVKDESLAYTEYSRENLNYYYEEDFKDFAAKANEEGKIVINNSLNDRKAMSDSYLLQFKGGEAAYQYFQGLESFWPGFQIKNLTLNNSLSFYVEMYPVYRTLRMALIWVSLLLICISIINVIRILEYSVTKEKNYLGMLEALGMDFNSKRRLFVFEILRSLVKTILISLVTGTIASVLVSVVFSVLMNSDSYSTTWITYSVPWGMYFAVIPAVILGTCFVVYALSNLLVILMNRRITPENVR